MSGKRQQMPVDFYARQRGATLDVDIWPRGGDVNAVQVCLQDTRAADDIRVSYDLERDGWVISQASTFSWTDDDPNIGDPDWQEVAFVKAWARERKEDP